MPYPAIPEPLSKVAVDLGFRPAPDPLARGTWGESQLMKMERWLDKLAYHLKRGRCFAPACPRHSCRRHRACLLVQMMPDPDPPIVFSPWGYSPDYHEERRRLRVLALRAKHGC